MNTAMLRGIGAGRGSRSHLPCADDAPAPGWPGRARSPSRRALQPRGTRSPSHRQELAPGARTAGPRGSRGRGGGRPGAGHGRAGTPTGPESRAGVSRPGNHIMVRPGYAGSAPTPSPRAPGVRHPKGRTTAEAGGVRLCPPDCRGAAWRSSAQAPRRLGSRPGTGTGGWPGTWNAWRKARPAGPPMPAKT